MGQRQVDLLEARAANDEAFELAVLGERLRGQLVEDARRAVGLEDDVAAVLAVADLGGRRGADQVGRRADRDDLAASENRDAIGQALGLVEVVRRENDRLAEAAKRAQGLPGLAARVRVEAGRRLVEEDQLGVADEREAEVEAAALPTRKAANYLVSLLAEADQLDDVVYRTRVRVVAGEQAQALGGCQRLVHRRGLEHDADLLAPAAAGKRGVDAEHLDAAAVPLAGALEDLDGRRLARAVRAEQAEDLAALDVEADPAHRLERAVRLAQVADGDRAHPS